MLGVYKQYHLMREESEGGRRHEILCDVRQRVGVAFDRGKEGSKNCLASCPACEAQMRGSERMFEEELVFNVRFYFEGN